MHNMSPAFFDVLQGQPVELQEFEKDISGPLLLINFPMDKQSQGDIQTLIVDAIMRRSCNPIQIHLRLKQGFNADMTLNRNELHDLSSLFISPIDNPKNKNNHMNQCKTKAIELAKFYVRIANIRARIIEEQPRQQSPHDKNDSIMMSGNLQRAYAIQKENMRNKQRENQEHLSRIMQTIILDPDSDNCCIHPAIKESDLCALELQLQDILESGCAANELRCIKIMEAAIEQQKYDALIAELNALDEM